jgi:hypothetical protein
MAHIQIPDVTPRNAYTASSGQTVFPYSFPIFAASDLVVYRAGVRLALGTDYTVSGAGQTAGGSVTLTSGATAGASIILLRDTPESRTSDYVDGGDFRADTINTDLDRLVAMVQQLARDIGRAVRLADLDPAAALAALPVSRAGQLLGFDGAGNPTMVPVTSAGPGTFLQDGGGAVGRLLVDKVKEWVTPLDFGAVGNGTTDDRAAIQAAINAVQDRGPQAGLYLAGRTYAIGGPLLMNGGECAIFGGQLTALAGFAADGSGSLAMLRLRSGLRMRVEDIIFDGNFVADGIHAETGSYQNEYIRVEGRAFRTFGIRTEDGAEQLIDQCIFTRSQSTAAQRTGVGIDIRSTDAEITNTVARFCGTPLRIAGNKTQVRGCHFYNSNFGVDTPITNSNLVEIVAGFFGQSFTGCYFDCGRIILREFDVQFSGCNWLFEDTPTHDAAFILDAGTTASRAFPNSLVIQGSYVPNPVLNGLMKWFKFTAGTGGSWSTESLGIETQADLLRTAVRTANLHERVEVVKGRRVWYKLGDPLASIELAGNGMTVPVELDWLSGQFIFQGSSIDLRVNSRGTFNTGIVRIEGSRTGAGVAGALVFHDRRGVDRKAADEFSDQVWKLRHETSIDATLNRITFIYSDAASNVDEECFAVDAFSVKVGPVRISYGTGSPEGVRVGNIGDLFIRIDGGVGTLLYGKTSNAGGNTGWSVV